MDCINILIISLIWFRRSDHGPHAASCESRRFFWNSLDLWFVISYNIEQIEYRIHETGDFVIYDPFDVHSIQVYDLRFTIFSFLPRHSSMWLKACPEYNWRDGVCVNLRLLTISRCLFMWIRGYINVHSWLIWKNKANLPGVKMGVSSVITSDYEEKLRFWAVIKPSQFKANSRPSAGNPEL